MKRDLRALASAGALLTVLAAADVALAQKQGGILRMYSPDSPASMSIHEEATIFAEGPMMGVFNNLVIYDQHVPQNSLQSIVPDLATSWSWNEDGTELTLPLREGITWHDGRPFTAKDVQCTWDMLTGKSSEISPREPGPNAAGPSAVQPAAASRTDTAGLSRARRLTTGPRIPRHRPGHC